MTGTAPGIELVSDERDRFGYLIGDREASTRFVDSLYLPASFLPKITRTQEREVRRSVLGHRQGVRRTPKALLARLCGGKRTIVYLSLEPPGARVRPVVVRIPRRTHDPERERVSYENIKYEVDNHIATLTLHRPERMNAMNIPTILELLDAIDHVDADDDVRCVIVTGAGRAFCAGADLQDGRDTFASETWAEQPHIAPFRQRDGGGILALRIYRSPKPFIAAINGSAVGFGLTLTLPMDIRLCAEDAKLGFVFSRRGIVLDAAAGWFLPRIVSMTWATDWAYTGRLFTPAEAARAGLVRDVYQGDEVHDAALDSARQIAEANPVSVACTKALLWRSASAATPWDAHRMETTALKFLGPRDDAAEGIRAFMEKRAPQFAGRVSTDMPPGYLPWEEPEWEPLPQFDG